MTDNFGDYIIYADESGDHSLEKIDEGFPIFCLALCIINKDTYINAVTPAIQKLKFDYWGHDKVVLHEREIRKQEGDFAFLRTDKKLRNEFLCRISEVVQESSFWVVSAVIRKNNLKEKYANPYNPYDIALKVCMEKLTAILRGEKQQGKKITCIFERRGHKEDAQLELEFYRIVNNQNHWGSKKVDFKQFEFEIKFASKNHNSTGLQLADLIARPIGLHVLKPEQENQAYEIISEKYNNGYRNKVFP